MAKQQKYFGFTSYLTEGRITREFVNDFEYWTKKIFYHWKLFMDYEEFQSKCWEALLEKLPEFDPEIATIQTFCLSRINNECWRCYMKLKQKRIEIDSDDPVIQIDLIAKESVDSSIYLDGFIHYADSKDVKVNADELYKNLQEEKLTPDVLAYLGWKIKIEKGMLG